MHERLGRCGSATLPLLVKTRKESAATSPAQNSCVCFKILVGISTLSSQYITLSNLQNNVLFRMMQHNDTMHWKDEMTNPGHKICPCLNWYICHSVINLGTSVQQMMWCDCYSVLHLITLITVHQPFFFQCHILGIEPNILGECFWKYISSQVIF